MRLLIASLALASLAAFAQDAKPPPTKAPQVYKWTDDKGVIHYTDKPPSQNATPAKLPPLQTYKGGTTPNLSRYEKPGAKAAGAPAAAGAVQIQIVTPSQNETFTGGQRVVPVAVVVTPELTSGQQLVYMLDGVPQATPTTSTSMDFTEVNRGAHTVSVSLVDATGQTVGQSGAVTFNVQQPIAGRAKQIHDQTSQPRPKK